MKQCSRCKIYKDFDSFGKLHKSKDGFRSCCKECRNKQEVVYYKQNAARSFQWRQENPERVKQHNLLWYQKNKERVLIQSAKWAQENPEKVYKASVDWRRRNPGLTAKRVYKWRLDNPEQFREQSRIQANKRRALKQNCAAPLTGQEWDLILQEFNYLCFWCGALWEEQEHIVALSKGGTHSKGNVVPSCADCNDKKYLKDPLEFYFENH